jgi:hypothetical protein
MFARLTSCLAALTLLAAGSASAGTIIIQHTGANYPTTEGFTQYSGTATPVPNDRGLGIAAFNMSGSWDSSQMYDGNVPVSQLLTTNWVLTANFADLSTNTTPNPSFGPDSYGSWVDLLLNGTRFDIDLHSDGAGGQVLAVDSIGSGPTYDIAGLGTGTNAGYALIQLEYIAATNTANYYVNGARVISDYAGYGTPWASQLAFGGENGNFNLIQLDLGATVGIPEPSGLTLTALGCLLMLLAKLR